MPAKSGAEAEERAKGAGGSSPIIVTDKRNPGFKERRLLATDATQVAKQSPKLKEAWIGSHVR